MNFSVSAMVESFRALAEASRKCGEALRESAETYRFFKREQRARQHAMAFTRAITSE